jgi:hypothetical protein
VGKRRLELSSLTQHRGHPDPGHPGGRQRAARLGGDLQRLLVGAKRGGQAAAGVLHLAEVTGGPHGQVALTGRPLPGDHAGKGGLGRRQPAAEPVGHRQEPVDLQAQRPVIAAEAGQGLLRGRGDPSASPRRRASSARVSAIDAGRLAIRLAARPTDGS